MDKQENQMILVSNRLPITTKKTKNGTFEFCRSAGGLVAGLREIHLMDNCVWLGHSGIFSEDNFYPQLKEKLMHERLCAVDLLAAEYYHYYNGACNNIIWPLFHYFPDYICCKNEDWQAYMKVNQKFADAVLAIAKAGDHIWVHDYQLMLLPALLRQANPALHVAYFHHIPFPSSELFRILQTRSEILQGLLGADIIGFHTYDYLRHFLTSVKRILGCDTHLDEIHHQGRHVRVAVHPLGVDVSMVRQHSDANIQTEELRQLARNMDSRKILLGIDRMDYTKGIPERLNAFRQLLMDYPEYIGQVTFLQISVPSRTDIPNYCDLKSKVEQLVGQINGEFSAPGYTPVQYLYRSFSQEEIIAFYRLADVAVVTPLRDGLNLVCKEYVAARDDEDGVLILSEMAGAAAEMAEALIINPYDSTSFVEAMRQALTMSKAERSNRMRDLRQRVIAFDNVTWLRSFTQNWREAVARNTKLAIRLHGNNPQQLLKQMHKAAHCFIFIDYDTGRDIDQSLLQLLNKIPHSQITLVTQQTSDSLIKNLETNYIADGGTYIYLHESKKELQISSPQFFSTLEADILRLLNNYTHQINGSFILRRSFALVFDYQMAGTKIANNQAHDLTVALSQLLENTAYGIYSEKGRIEIRCVIADRSHAIASVLEHLNYQVDDVIITIGDNQICEDLHNAIRYQYQSSYSMTNYHFEHREDIQHLIEKMAESFDKNLCHHFVQDDTSI